MSVTWQPPGKLLCILAVFLCMVTALPLVAQPEEIPVAAADEPATVAEPQSSSASERPVSSTGTLAPLTPQEVQAYRVKPADEGKVVTRETQVSADQAEGSQISSVKQSGENEQQDAVLSETESTVKIAPSAASVPVAVQVKESATTAAKKREDAKTGLAKYADIDRLNVFIIIVFLLGFVSYFTFHAQRGKDLFIRRISGLSALEDAVGRATEMGRGVLYIPGIMDMDDIQTIAGVTILGQVAKKTAEYDTPLYAPMTRSFVMSVAQEIVKQAYLEKGRPDAFRPDRINYLTDDQFGYVAGVSGIMMRDKPAACFYLGTFYAESLILAETGNSVGAIQIAGTAEPSQIPFFVAACDYTLIGEELFAASAYLSKNPKEVGSLKGQDVSKIIIIAFIIIGTVLVSIAQTEIGIEYGINKLADNYMKLFK
jgi:hypothetical protein